jgi:sec-independent protein translocase protein TatA
MLYLQKQLALMGGLQGPELMLILVLILIFFGAKKLPELAKGLGQGIKEFKKSYQRRSARPPSSHGGRHRCSSSTP